MRRWADEAVKQPSALASLSRTSLLTTALPILTHHHAHIGLNNTDSTADFEQQNQNLTIAVHASVISIGGFLEFGDTWRGNTPPSDRPGICPRYTLCIRIFP